MSFRVLAPADRVLQPSANDVATRDIHYSRCAVYGAQCFSIESSCGFVKEGKMFAALFLPVGTFVCS